MQQVNSRSARLIALPQQLCIALVFVLLLVWGAPSAAGELVVFEPERVSRDFSVLGIASKQVYRIDANLHVVAGSDERQSADDYGARLYVVSGDKRLFRSHGMMDSYYLELTFLRASAATATVLILAESGDEGGSYGVSVFELRGKQVRDLGSVDALIDGGEQLLSVVPHLRVTSSGAGYEFRVTRDVLILDHEVYEYRSIDKQKIRYLYDGQGAIRRVVDP